MKLVNDFVPSSGEFILATPMVVGLILTIIIVFGFNFFSQKVKPRNVSKAFIASGWVAFIGGLIVFSLMLVGSAATSESARSSNVQSLMSWVDETYHFEISENASQVLLDGGTVWAEGKSVALVQTSGEGFVLVNTHDGWGSITDNVKTEAEKRGE